MPVKRFILIGQWLEPILLTRNLPAKPRNPAISCSDDNFDHSVKKGINMGILLFGGGFQPSPVSVMPYFL